MTLKEKTKLLFTRPKNLLSSSPFWAHIVAKYLLLRSSRFGFKNIVQKLLAGRNYLLCSKRPPCSICCRFNDGGDIIAWQEVFEDRVYNLESLPFEPEMIIDAGAHIGTFTILAYARFPRARFVAFEPSPANFTMLTENKSLNKVSAELYNCALADYDGLGSMCGESGIGMQLKAPTGSASVSVRRLSSIANLDQVTSLVLKCDTEGMEYQILSDILPKIPKRTVVFLESHGGPSETRRLRELLEGAGFSFKISRSRGLYEDCMALRT